MNNEYALEMLGNMLLRQARNFNRMLNAYGFNSISEESVTNAFYKDGEIPLEYEMEIIIEDIKGESLRSYAYPNLANLLKKHTNRL